MFSFPFQRTVQRLIYALLILALAGLWILLSARPVSAATDSQFVTKAMQGFHHDVGVTRSSLDEIPWQAYASRLRKDKTLR